VSALLSQEERRVPAASSYPAGFQTVFFKIQSGRLEADSWCDPGFSSTALLIPGERNYSSNSPTKHPYLRQKHLGLLSPTASKWAAPELPARD